MADITMCTFLQNAKSFLFSSCLTQILRHLQTSLLVLLPFLLPVCASLGTNLSVSSPTNMKSATNQQESYVRARDNPFFDGMRRGEAAGLNKTSISEFQGKSANKINRSASDIGAGGARKMNIVVDTITEDAAYIPNSSSLMDIVLEPVARSSSEKWTKTSSLLVNLPSDSDILEPRESIESPTVLSTIVNEEEEETYISPSPAVLRSYSVNKRQTDLSDVPLPPSAALFYIPSPQMEVVESCESIHKLNMYLKAKKVDVNAGVPGKFLHAVIGPDSADVGSVVSSIMYAFYLHQTTKNKEYCTVPVINMKRADLDRRTDLQWLFDSCHVDLSNFIFIDEIDLFYYDLFGSLKVVLVNCSSIPSSQEALKEAIVEIFSCTKSDVSYSWINSITVQEDASCCTVIAEKFVDLSPVILAGKGFSRLLLAGILLDTGNLSSPFCTSKDNYIATLLINGAGRFGCDGLYRILKHKSPGASSDLEVRKILMKEFKKWTGSDSSRSGVKAPNVGMSSIGMSVVQLLAHDPTASVQEIVHFRKSENLGLHLVVSGYYDSQKKFKREILVAAESAEMMRHILVFLNLKSAELPLKDLHKPGPKDEMRVFEIDKITSRKTIERILEEYTSAN